MRIIGSQETSAALVSAARVRARQRAQTRARSSAALVSAARVRERQRAQTRARNIWLVASLLETFN